VGSCRVDVDLVSEEYLRSTRTTPARLRRYFDDGAIVELTGLIALQNLSSRFNAALDLPPQGFCKLPQL
jgi:alkylhydroperoxidase family enzyme